MLPSLLQIFLDFLFSFVDIFPETVVEEYNYRLYKNYNSHYFEEQFHF